MGLARRLCARGGQLAVVSGDGIVRLWNLTTGEIQKLAGHTGFAVGIRFSPDGSILATSDQTGTIILWDWKAERVLRTLSGHQGPVYDLAISSDGRMLASASRDHSARLWDVTTGELLARFLGASQRVWSLDFSPDTRTLVSVSGEAVRFWSTAPRQEGQLLTHTGEDGSIGYSPDGHFLYLDEWHFERISLWDPTNRTRLHVLPGRDIRYSPDARIFTLIRNDTNIVIYDAATLQVQATIPGTSPVRGATAISPDGKWLVVRRGDTPVVFDLLNRREFTTLEGAGNEFAFTPGGRTLIAKDRGGIRLWDALTWGRSRWLRPANAGTGPIGLSPDGRTLAAEFNDDKIRLFDLSAPSVPPTVLGFVSGTWRLAFSPDGRTLAVGTYDGPIKLWSVPGRREVGSFKSHLSIVRSLAFSPDGRTLASLSYDSTARLWTPPAGPH